MARIPLSVNCSINIGAMPRHERRRTLSTISKVLTYEMHHRAKRWKSDDWLRSGLYKSESTMYPVQLD